MAPADAGPQGSLSRPLRYHAALAVHGAGDVITTNRVTLLADVAGVVAKSHDLEETLGNVVDLVAKRLDADVCSIYLTDSDLEFLTLRATRGLAAESVGVVRLQFGEGLVGIAARDREPVAVENAQADPRYRYFPGTGEERYVSLMAAPLLVRGVTIGVLVVQTEHARHFDSQDVELLQTCAQLIAPVVMNARLLDLVTRSEEERNIVVSRLAMTGLPVDVRAREPAAAQNVELRGSPSSPGIAIGAIHRLEDPVDLGDVDYVPSANPAQEKRDLLRAVTDARRELDGVRDDMSERFGPEFAAVFNTHIQILEDKGFVKRLERAVAQSANAVQALRDVLDAYRQTFERIEDPYFRERGADIEDVGRRVAARLLGVRHHAAPLQEGAIVIADNILPAHFATLEIEKIAALVSEHGGSTSHGAIFARSLEIPAVTGVAGIRAAVREGETAIVDGASGRVYLRPDAALRAQYERAQHHYEVAVEHLDTLRDRPAVTSDGSRIRLTANVGLLNDLRLVDRHGAEGVGLFRTELLAIAHRGFPEEEEQERLYERVVKHVAPRPVTIRTLDLGGDKSLDLPDAPIEENPQLGWRSTRLMLSHGSVFRAQLRAILRASASRNVRVLFPLIGSVEELRAAREILEAAKRELEARGTPFDPEVPVGVMIEVPSAALVAEALAKECDFFSIGTNDLTQYTLAVDRGNERVAHLYDSLHPAVLALIDRAVRAAQRARIPVSVCGEMASSPLAVPLLVGLGIGELSGSPSAVPVVKEIVRALDAGEAALDVRRALAVGTATEVRAIAAARLRASGLLEHPDIGGWLRSVIES